MDISSETLNRFIDTIKDGIGEVWHYYIDDKKILKIGRAQAENEKLMIIKKAEGEAIANYIRGESESELRAFSRLKYQEIKKQKNIEKITEGAIPFLEGENSKGSIDEDWINNFFNHAGNISNEQLQIIWSKVLAGEVKNPGSYSIRLLDSLKNISKEEAEDFNKIAGLSVESGLIFRLSNNFDKIIEITGLKYEKLLNLSEIGLINIEQSLCYTFKDNEKLTKIKFNGTDVFIFNGDKLNNKNFPVIKMTKIGEALGKIISKKVDKKYIEEFLEYLKNMGIDCKI